LSLFAAFRKKASLEIQWETLASCGIRANNGIEIKDALSSWSREQYESDPFKLLLVFLGGDLEQEPYPRVSNSVWHLDTECIEGHGDYARVATRMSLLAGGQLPITDIADYVDVEEGMAWLSFHLDGKETKWEAKVDDDWIDPSILSNFVRLLDSRGATRRFTYLDLGGQDCIVGCSTEEEFTKLKELTKLTFQWLE
jgi:hypothetical protein